MVIRRPGENSATALTCDVQRSSQCANLNSYSAAYSWENSGVQFGANRVQSLRLVGGRRYTRDGRVYSWSVAN